MIQSIQETAMKKTDARVENVTESMYTFSLMILRPADCPLEAMSVVRMIKLFGWEPQIAARIHGKRDDELHQLLKTEMSELVVNVLKFV